MSDESTYQEPPRYLNLRERFGIQMKRLRTEHGYTQLQLATEMHADRSYLSDVENGKKAMTLNMMWKLATALDMNLSQLLLGIG